MTSFQLLINLLLLSAASYRITRFTQLDTLIENTRDQLALWLRARVDGARSARSGAVYAKLLDGMLCAFCVSVWVAGLLVLFMAGVTPYQLEWMSIVHWLAVAAGTMAVYRYIDPPE